MFDGLFNIPTPGFLRTHRLEFFSMRGVQYTSDDEGWAIAQEFEGGGEQLLGYAAAPDLRRVNTTNRVDVVVRGIGHDVPVQPGDWIVIPEQPSLLPFLAGRYRVNDDGVRPNPMDLRLMLSRPRQAGQTDVVDSNPYVEVEE